MVDISFHSILSALRRQKVTEEGAFVLVRDMDEYHNVFVLMDCEETQDLIICLREIVYIFMTPAENVVKVSFHYHFIFSLFFMISKLNLQSNSQLQLQSQ